MTSNKQQYKAMMVLQQHDHVHGACSCPCCMPMPTLHAHVHAACPYPGCISMSMLYVHVHVRFSCSRCMPTTMLHVHAACPQTVAFWTTKAAPFCKEIVTEPPTTTASPMTKVMEVMAILPRVTVAKSESNSGTGI